MSKLSLVFCVFLACNSSPQPAYPDTTIRLKIYNVIGTDSLTEAEVYQAVDWAESKVSAAGYHIQVIAYKELSSGNVDSRLLYDLQYQDARVVFAQTYLSVTRDREPWIAHYFIWPPIQHDGLKLFGGMSNGVCSLSSGALAMGQGGAWSSHTPPRPRIDASGMIIAHEVILGHGAGGMNHHSIEDGYLPNIMDQAAGRFVDSNPELSYLPESIAEADSCLGRVRSNWIRRCKSVRQKRHCMRRFDKKFMRSSSTLPVFE